MGTKMKHLELIQGVINRLAGNSFMIKGWSVTLVTALNALAAKDSKQMFVYVAYLPALVFWALDGYFLQQERRFRAVYDDVRRRDEDTIDFSMAPPPGTMIATTWLAVTLSTTLLLFHGAIIASVICMTLVTS